MFLGDAQFSCAQEDEFTLEEIVVTSQKREEKVQDVPVAITVANREQVERQQINAITELDRITPALEFKNPDNGSSGGGQIRGIGTTDYTASSTGSVTVVIDSVPAGVIPNPNVGGILCDRFGILFVLTISALFASGDALLMP